MNLIHRDRMEKEVCVIKSASKMAKALSRLVKEGKIDVSAMTELTGYFKTQMIEDIYDEDEYNKNLERVSTQIQKWGYVIVL